MRLFEKAPKKLLRLGPRVVTPWKPQMESQPLAQVTGVWGLRPQRVVTPKSRIRTTAEPWPCINHIPAKTITQATCNNRSLHSCLQKPHPASSIVTNVIDYPVKS